MKFGNCFKVQDSRTLTGIDFRRLFEAALNKIQSNLLIDLFNFSNEVEFINAKVALAISGGSDSMALAALASEHFGKDRVIGFIVDHQLQNFGVTENPLKVQENLDKLGIRSNVLKLSWHCQHSAESSIIPGKLMMRSRDKRYKVLFDECKAENISLLLTGHNLEDDVVTMFYRISRMSGTDGLAGMKLASTFPFAVPESDSTFILRPLLSVPKQKLINTCVERKISWTHDASNDDLSFRRNECLKALIQIQNDNKSVTTESLFGMLESFKGHRAYMHHKVIDAFSKSVILSKTIGDATLILNNPSLTSDRFLFNRVLTILIQFTTVSPYPPKTSSLNRIFKEVHDEYIKYQTEKTNKTKTYVSSVLSSSSTSSNDPRPLIKRIDFPQHTLAGASMYALSKNDTLRRLSNFQNRSGKNLLSGPALLVQREFPSKKDLKTMNEIKHDFSDFKSFLWDNRIFIRMKPDADLISIKPLIFDIKPLSTELVKEFERITKKDFSSRRNLYSYLGMTPGSHLHTVPVLHQAETGYMAIPTLSCYSDRNMYAWEIFNASHMFRIDFIPYKIIPVSGFTELSSANEEHIQGQDDIRNIIMLGCGGIVDLSEYLSLSHEVSVWVFDNNRPYNLRNIFTNTQITVIDDGFIQENYEHLEDAYFALDLPEDFEDIESDCDESDDGLIDEVENDVDLSNQSSSSSKPKNVSKKKDFRYKMMCKEKLEEYSNALWTGTPLSSVLFGLCDSKGCINNDLLWYAITGVTDQYIRTALSENAYIKQIQTLKNAQERLNPNAIQKSKSDSNSSSSGLINSDGVISFEPDLRFALLRHWSVYGSMLNSDFVASRLGTWREKGRRELELLLAKIAFPLNQCKSDYSAMDLEYREIFTVQLEKFAKEFSIENFSYPSFIREFGYILKISAADCVHSLRSIVECPNILNLSKTAQLTENISAWKNNFYFAFDAIEYKNTEHLKLGIDLSMKQHGIIYKEACTILSHRLIKLCKSFRYVVVKNGPDLSWMTSVATVTRLCKFLIESTKKQRKGSALPLVVAVYNSSSDTFLITSMEGESHSENKQAYKSIVGPTLRKAASIINARVKVDSFDLNSIEVKSSDLKSFIKSLQSVLSENY